MNTLKTPRPKRSDESILNTAALSLAPKVLKCIEQSGFLNDGDSLESVANELKKAIYCEDDGYKIAKKLEGEGWYPDAELVEILNEASTAKYHAQNAAMREWMKASGLTPPAIGDRVRSVNEVWRSDHTGLIGTVVSHYEDRGQSTVAFAELGHGVEKGGRKTIGVIIGWENLEVVDHTSS